MHVSEPLAAASADRRLRPSARRQRRRWSAGRCAMKTFVVGLVSGVAALGAPAIASADGGLISASRTVAFGTSAQAAARTTCAHAPRAEFPIQEVGTSCKVARDVERWNDHNELALSNNPRIDGHRWHGTLYSRAHGRTYYRFTTRGAAVWITYRQGVD
jgi:hypothetical protein